MRMMKKKKKLSDLLSFQIIGPMENSMWTSIDVLTALITSSTLGTQKMSI